MDFSFKSSHLQKHNNLKCIQVSRETKTLFVHTTSNIRPLITCAMDSGPVFRVSSEKSFIENRWEGWVRTESTLQGPDL